MSDHLITICSRCGSSRSNHHFHCLSLIHRCIAGGDLVQADREIQNGRGIEPTLKDLVQQFWQIGARWSQPSTQADIGRKHAPQRDLSSGICSTRISNAPRNTAARMFFLLRAFYSSRRRACAEIHSIDGLRRSGYSFIIWEKNCNCVGLAARRPLASLRYFRVAAMFDGSSSRVLSL